MRERERKAKRALAELGQSATVAAAALVPNLRKTPAAKRKASVAKARAKAKANAGYVQQIEPPDTPMNPPEPEEPKEPARAPPPNPAAASSSSSSSCGSTRAATEPDSEGEPELKVVLPMGGGKAKGSGKSARKEWDYEEGVNGKYTCAQCGRKPLRSWFLIEAMDLEGNLSPGYDKEGYLQGRCYECCRGRGKYAGPEDIYADQVDEGYDEETLENIFRRECNKRHDKRHDVKKNEWQLLRIKEWKELLAKITEKCRRRRP